MAADNKTASFRLLNQSEPPRGQCADCRYQAKGEATAVAALKADLLDRQKRWLALARSYAASSKPTEGVE
jgi:hypothetical protein